MKINPRFLRTHRFLSLLPSATLRKLANGAASRDYPKGSVVFSQGQPSEAMYLIVSGRCESRHLDPSGHWITAIHGPGDTLGDREVLHHEPYLATLTVATQSVLLRIPEADLREVFDTAPRVAGRISQSIVRRIIECPETAPGKRIVALHALSPRINERALGRRLADTLAQITHRSVLSVHFGTAPAAISLAEWGDGPPGLNGSFGFSHHVREVRRSCFELDVHSAGSAAEASCVAPLLGHLGNHFDFVLIDVASEVAQPALLECLVQSDLTYILMRPESESIYGMKLLTGSLGGENGATYKHIHAVICADNVDAAARFAADCQKAGFEPHSILPGFPLAESNGGIDRSPALAIHIRRMAREIGRCRIG